MDAFREPREVFTDIDEANDKINRLNGQIQQLCRERTHWQNRKDDARQELRAMAEDDGHLRGCSRSDRCLGDGWCRLGVQADAAVDLRRAAEVAQGLATGV